MAIGANSEVNRIDAKELKGRLGDPWTPIRKEDGVALTVPKKGFDYGLISKLLANKEYLPSFFFQQMMPAVSQDYIVLHGRALVRGQGITEGYHERRVVISKETAEILFNSRSKEQQIAEIIEKRIAAVAEMRGKVLRPALFCLLQQGPDEINYGAVSTKAQVEPYLHQLETGVDRDFFKYLWPEIEAETEDEQHAERNKWLREMRKQALSILKGAAREVPQADMRRYRGRVKAEGLFWGSCKSHFGDIEEDRENE